MTVVSAQVWKVQSSGTTSQLNDVSFCDSSNGIAVGSFGTILRTTDAGVTWVPQTSGTTAELRRVMFISRVYAIAFGDVNPAGPSYILRTTDGGNSWATADSLTDWPRGLWMTDSLHAFIASNSGQLHRTTNGGASWFVQATMPVQLFGIAFSDARHGALVGGKDGFYGGRIYGTTDGGTTWTLKTDSAWYELRAVACPDSDHIVAAGYQGVLIQTTDNGLSWHQQQIGSRFDAVSFSDANNGYALSYYLMVHTSDGGNSWNTLGQVYENGICAFAPGAAILVGPAGAVMTTSPDVMASIPPMELSDPADGSSNVSVSTLSPPFALDVSWNAYPYFEFGNYSRAFWLQCGTDSTFSSGLLFDRAFGQNYADGGFTPDISGWVYPLLPGTKLYWRMKYNFQTASGPWSPTWSFTTATRSMTTIEQIQTVPPSSLALADFYQDQNPAYASYQASSLLSRPLFVIARCVVPPADLLQGTQKMIVSDTGAVRSGWHGIAVVPDAAFPPAQFPGVRRGDVFLMYGWAKEVPSDYTGYQAGSMNSMTEFQCQSLFHAGTDGSRDSLIVVPVSQFHTGPAGSGITHYSTGEQYEGMRVELHGLTVVAVSTAQDGSVTLADSIGNQIMTTDLSRWFTLRSHRDSASAFSTPIVGSMIDTLRGVVYTVGNSDAPLSGLGYRIAPVWPGDISWSPGNRGAITGTVFNDDNRNGVRDAGEGVLSGWHINLSGKHTGSTVSNQQGGFYFSGLDSGSYTVTEPNNQNLPWALSTPPSRAFSLTLGSGDTSGGYLFGNYFPWSEISGRLFHDVNENGILDSNESPLQGWPVALSGGAAESTVTDSAGRFRFTHLNVGVSVVSVRSRPGWEAVPAWMRRADSVPIEDFGKVITIRDIALHRIPARTRMKLRVYDSQSIFQDLWWGVRPGTTAGIFGADGHATNYDFSEGEAEVPPRDYAKLLGLFDARFLDPGGTGGYFGYGSWTDMRNFTGAAQGDVYKIAFLPALSSGYGYPIVLTWNPDSVRANYSGSVSLSDASGQLYADMKWNSYLSVDDPAIEYLWLTAWQPMLSDQYLPRWYMLSLPGQGMVPVSKIVSARSTAYSYNPAGGYERNDSLRPGTGYWLKYARGIDTALVEGLPRMLDTIGVLQGWNLIGVPGLPVNVFSIASIPPGIVTGKYFAYDGKYVPEDTLRPGFAYWVKCLQDGELILNPGTPPVALKSSVKSALSGAGMGILRVSDTLGNEQTLYFRIAGASPEEEELNAELPPPPPEGIFDVRFRSNRLIETAAPGAVRKAPISISGAMFPVILSWDVRDPSLAATLVAGRDKFFLRGRGSRLIRSSGESLALEFGGGGNLPAEFALGQNYPNPFNPVTTISYALPQNAHVTLNVYNVLGQRVATLVDGLQTAGYKDVSFDASAFASGLYYYRLTAGSFTAVKKMLLVK